MFQERRKCKRFPISEIILFRRANGTVTHRYCTAEAKDVSEAGIFFHTEELLFEGDRIELCFRERTAFADSRTTAEVVRVVRCEGGYGVGARFLPAIVNVSELASGHSAVR